MQTITRKKGAFYSETFKLDLSEIDRNSTDIVEIFFAVKDILTDDDDDLILKDMTGGDITYSGKTKLVVSVAFNSADTDALTLDHVYKAGLFIQFSGDPSADERVSQTFNFCVIQDFLINN